MVQLTALPERRSSHTGKARCPHCDSTAVVRSSRRLSPIYREQIMQCTNAHCGHTYVVGAEVLRTLSPSATPNPDVDIPLSPKSYAGVKRAEHA